MRVMPLGTTVMPLAVNGMNIKVNNCGGSGTDTNWATTKGTAVMRHVITVMPFVRMVMPSGF